MSCIYFLGLRNKEWLFPPPKTWRLILLDVFQGISWERRSSCDFSGQANVPEGNLQIFSSHCSPEQASAQHLPKALPRRRRKQTHFEPAKSRKLDIWEQFILFRWQWVTLRYQHVHILIVHYQSCAADDEKLIKEHWWNHCIIAKSHLLDLGGGLSDSASNLWNDFHERRASVSDVGNINQIPFYKHGNSDLFARLGVLGMSLCVILWETFTFGFETPHSNVLFV